MPEYSLILLFWLAVVIWAHVVFKIKVYQTSSQAILMTMLFYAIGYIWDIFGVIRGHWFFGTNGLIGVNLFGLPLEEHLFHLIVPITILTVYKLTEIRVFSNTS
jgi:lycopene cyclase domain-containing protein